jgi:hypothetical protein
VRTVAALAPALLATPAVAAVAASPLQGRCADGPVASCASEVLFLQGKLPGGSTPILVRCAVRTTAEGKPDNCQRVF